MYLGGAGVAKVVMMGNNKLQREGEELGELFSNRLKTSMMEQVWDMALWSNAKFNGQSRPPLIEMNVSYFNHMLVFFYTLFGY